jgi:hypothetical protein
MDVGKPKRTFTVEPIEDPVPRRAPAERPPAPRKEPVEPAKR